VIGKECDSYCFLPKPLLPFWSRKGTRVQTLAALPLLDPEDFFIGVTVLYRLLSVSLPTAPPQPQSSSFEIKSDVLRLFFRSRPLPPVYPREFKVPAL